ncbi:MAG: GNAT family N-acetyltransferase [Saprospiraceae bacterium]
MIQIIPIKHLASSDFEDFITFVLAQDATTLETIKDDWTLGDSSFLNLNEGLFLVLKEGKVIGFGSVLKSPDVPLTAGITLANHCHIIPAERRKGYGNQLFRHLRQFAQIHFDFLQLKETCPLYHRTGGMIDLEY